MNDRSKIISVGDMGYMHTAQRSPSGSRCALVVAPAGMVWMRPGVPVNDREHNTPLSSALTTISGLPTSIHHRHGRAEPSNTPLSPALTISGLPTSVRHRRGRADLVASRRWQHPFSRSRRRARLRANFSGPRSEQTFAGAFRHYWGSVHTWQVGGWVARAAHLPRVGVGGWLPNMAHSAELGWPPGKSLGCWRVPEVRVG